MGEDFAPLVDVTGIDLRDLLADEDSALAACVRRLVDQLDDPDGVVAAFGSFVE